jgi:hypothetical protein
LARTAQARTTSKEAGAWHSSSLVTGFLSLSEYRSNLKARIVASFNNPAHVADRRCRETREHGSAYGSREADGARSAGAYVCALSLVGGRKLGAIAMSSEHRTKPTEAMRLALTVPKAEPQPDRPVLTGVVPDKS